MVSDLHSLVVMPNVFGRQSQKNTFLFTVLDTRECRERMCIKLGNEAFVGLN